MTSTAVAPAEGRPAAPAGHTGALSHRQILVIFSGLMLGLFLAALDQTIVATSIRTISDDLHGLSLQAWATTAYLITATISTPLYGKLSDLYGRKPFFLAAISIFIAGSLLCSVATSMYELAGFRALQGVGAGGLFSLALAIIGDVVPPRERARYQGYFLAVFGTSSVLGPVIGGALAGQASILGVTGWRWVFLVNVPIAAAALVVVAKVLNIPHTRRHHRIDFLGALTIAVALVPLLVVAEQGRDWGWGSDRALACYLIGAVGLVAFLLAERRIGEDALLPLYLFRNGVFSQTSLAGFVIGVGMFGGIATLPQYLQIVKGASPTKAGLLTVPLVLGIMVASVVSGQITARTGRYKIFPVIGTILMTGALVLLWLRLGASTPLWEADIYMALFGLGLGGCMQTLMLAVQNAVPARDMGVATASATFFRQMGGTLGTAVFLSVLFSTVTGKIGAAFRAIAPTPQFQAMLADPAVRANPNDAAVLHAIQSGGIGANASGVLQDSSFLQRIDPRLARPFLVGFSNSFDLVFLIGAFVMVIGVVVMLFLKEVPLRALSGLEARAAELAAEGGAGPAPAPVAAEAVAAARTPPVGQPAVAGGVGVGPTLPRRIPALVGAGAAGDGRGTGVAVATAAGSGRDGRDGAGSSLIAGTGEPDTGEPGWAYARSDDHASPVIFGQVTRGGGAPLAGATLTLTDLTGRQLDRDSSNGSGHYRLGPSAGGTYLVICASATHRPRAARVAVTRVPVRHDVVLAGGGTSLSGRVQLADGSEVGGAVVTLTDVSGDIIGSTVTDDTGGYRFDDLTAGNYTLTTVPRHRQPVAQGLSLPAEGQVHADVEVAARARLLGRVRSATAGLPVAEALATLVDGDGNVVGSAITDSAGGFVFDDLAAGQYTVIATGYPPVTSEVHVEAGQPTEAVLGLRPHGLGPHTQAGAEGPAPEERW